MLLSCRLPLRLLHRLRQSEALAVHCHQYAHGVDVFRGTGGGYHQSG